MESNTLTIRDAGVRQLVETLEKQNAMKRDLVVPTTAMRYDNGQLVVNDLPMPSAVATLLASAGVATSGASGEELRLTPTSNFDTQLGAKLGIPAAYFDRMRGSAVELLDHNVNHWLGAEPRNYLVRSFVDDSGGGIARAFLSDRFRVVDNYDILFAALQAIRDLGVDAKIDGCDLTDRRMYVRFVVPEIRESARELIRSYRAPKPHDRNKYNLGDDMLIGGFVLGNSEIGAGSYFVAPRMVAAVCWNGMIRMTDSMRKVHLGTQLKEGAIEWSEKTQEQMMKTTLLQIKDAVTAFLSPEYLERTITAFTEKAAEPLKHPIDAVTNVCKHLGMSDTARSEILSAFVAGGDTTPFGITQALTWTAQRASDGDQQFDMELAAVDILDQIDRFDKPVAKQRPSARPNYSLN